MGYWFPCDVLDLNILPRDGSIQTIKKKFTLFKYNFKQTVDGIMYTTSAL